MMGIYKTKRQWMASREYERLRRQVFGSQSCRCGNCETQAPLELHHKTYRFGSEEVPGEGPNWGGETPGDVVGLCRECHRAAHIDFNGEFWGDVDEMNSHWESYLNAC